MDWTDRLASKVEELLRKRMKEERTAAAERRRESFLQQTQPTAQQADSAASQQPQTASPQQMSGPVLYYTQEVIDHFTNPRNVGEMPEEEADGYALIGDPLCGDQMKLWINVEDERIVDIRFRSYGCPGAIATSSMTTELARDRTVEEALNLSDDDVISALGGIPENKRHCSLLGINALHAAVVDFMEKTAAADDPPSPQSS